MQSCGCLQQLLQICSIKAKNVRFNPVAESVCRSHCPHNTQPPSLSLSRALFSEVNNKKVAKNKTKPPRRKRTQVHACGNVVLLGLITRCVQQRHNAIIIRSQQGCSTSTHVSVCLIN